MYRGRAGRSPEPKRRHTISNILKNIEVRFNTDFASDTRDGYVAISFTHPEQGDSLDWIDEDGTLCIEQRRGAKPRLLPSESFSPRRIPMAAAEQGGGTQWN